MTIDTKAPSLREALEFYADPDNWMDTPSWDGDPDNTTPKAIPILRNDEGHPCDCGDTARKALAALDAPITGAWKYEIKYGRKAKLTTHGSTTIRTTWFAPQKHTMPKQSSSG